jgi:hypothetical protein
MKRFTDTSKWSDPWFRRLSAPAKMLWFYILDHCDSVGMIELDLDLAAQDCGVKITDATLSEIGDRVEPAGKGKLIVPKFIKFQIGEPSESCKAHTKIIQAIDELELFKDSEGYHYPNHRLLIDYPMTINSHKEKEKEEDKEEEEDKAEKPKSKNRPNDRSELDDFFAEVGLTANDAEYAWHHWEGKGWRNGSAAIKDWRATVRSWKAAGYWPSQKGGAQPEPAKSKPKTLPANWREIGQLRYGRDFSGVEIEQLTYDEFGDIQRDCRFYADNPEQLAADMAQADQLSPL